jgi:hypothetical protein
VEEVNFSGIQRDCHFSNLCMTSCLAHLTPGTTLKTLLRSAERGGKTKFCNPGQGRKNGREIDEATWTAIVIDDPRSLEMGSLVCFMLLITQPYYTDRVSGVCVCVLSGSQFWATSDDGLVGKAQGRLAFAIPGEKQGVC